MVAHPEPMVTGDAVVLDVAIAQLPVRAISAFIDVTVMFTGYFIGLVLAATVLARFDDALAGAVVVIFTVLTIVGYPLVFEVATRGRTLGKMAMGLRVVSDDGGPERFRQALFRALASVIEIWLLAGGPAVICSLLSSKGKRIGDVFAGTIVISERTQRLSALPPMPPALAWWAASLQMSGLRQEQAERARQFLSRASQLDPQIRSDWGTGSAPRSSRRSARLPRRVRRHHSSWPRYWPNVIAGSSSACSRGTRSVTPSRRTPLRLMPRMPRRRRSSGRPPHQRPRRPASGGFAVPD